MNSVLPSTPSWVASSKNSLLIKALHSKNEGNRPPIWIMRQAGRALPAYRAIREKHSLEEMFRKPELINTITKLPLDVLGVDAAILFADILHVLLPLGFDVSFPGKQGPVVTPGNKTEDLSFVKQGIDLLKKELCVPLIGFSGGPFTVASYVAGKKIKKWIYSDPKDFQAFLKRLTDTTIDYLKMQIDAGVDVIQIFDSWANILPEDLFDAYVLPPLHDILEALRPSGVPVILFARGSSHTAPKLAQLNPHAISIDFLRPLAEVRKEIPRSIALQGNLDPELLYASPEIIQQETHKLLESMKGDPGFIVNLGHGLLPDLPLENIQTFVSTVTKWQ